METEKIGIREFRENLAGYLEGGRSLAITRHGQTLGFFIPAQRRNRKAELEAMRAAGLDVEVKTGLTPEERCAALPGFRGIKLEIACNAAHSCMRHVATAARTFNFPVLQHSWSTTNIKDRIHQSDPVDTARFARRNPDVKVIMAHLTGCGYRGVLEAKGVDNLVVDTSGAFPEAGILDYALEHLGADNIVYGSDLPIRETGVTLHRTLGTAMSAAEREKILYGNARRILKL